MQLPTQTSENTRMRRRQSQSFDDPVRLAYEKLSPNQKGTLLKSHYQRKQLLNIPKDILESHPDKYFVWINMNKLQANGMWHPEGYKLLKSSDSDNQSAEKFNESSDGYVHRNEMVLAYLPMDDWVERQLEQMAARDERDLIDIITKNENLAGFHPHGKHESETVVVKEKK